MIWIYINRGQTQKLVVFFGFLANSEQLLQVSVLCSSCTMASNTSLFPSVTKPSKNEQAGNVDVEAVMENVSIILYTLTVVLGITGNSVVIWVAGFKLKVYYIFVLSRSSTFSSLFTVSVMTEAKTTECVQCVCVSTFLNMYLA